MGTIGTRIREARESKRLLQHDLADRLRTKGYGTTQATISRWEAGQVPRGYVLRALADELGVSVDDLLGEAHDDGESRAMPILDHREMLTALAVALEPFLPSREQVRA